MDMKLYVVKYHVPANPIQFMAIVRAVGPHDAWAKMVQEFGSGITKAAGGVAELEFIRDIYTVPGGA